MAKTAHVTKFVNSGRTVRRTTEFSDELIEHSKSIIVTFGYIEILAHTGSLYFCGREISEETRIYYVEHEAIVGF